MTGRGVIQFYILVLLAGVGIYLFNRELRQDLRAYEQTDEGCEYLTAARDIENTYFYKCGDVIIMKEVK